MLAALTDCLSAWQHAQSWDGFVDALSVVEKTAGQAGHLALHDVCTLLQERLTSLARAGAPPDEEQCAVLATWPSFASAWAESPGEPHLGELLVEFLQHPMWPNPLPDDDAENLRIMLGVESGAHGTASMLEVVIENMHTDGRPDDGLPGYDGLSGYAKVGSPAGAGRFVPEVRARMAAGAEDHEVEDLSAGMDLGSVAPDASEDALEPPPEALFVDPFAPRAPDDTGFTSEPVADDIDEEPGEPLFGAARVEEGQPVEPIPEPTSAGDTTPATPDADEDFHDGTEPVASLADEDLGARAAPKAPADEEASAAEAGPV
ncbi:MAG: hypothetical protein GWN71_31895, partial [Gammaproteobacteria bacterium]|nr:hypothetical protein [Gemmatimonadota bacterium]NIR35208.1 hypothetical protein [Actinomycetota bacterium]NIU77990.1 hypothetical protein [Gammaproteobacteria bacterium]